MTRIMLGIIVLACVALFVWPRRRAVDTVSDATRAALAEADEKRADL